MLNNLLTTQKPHWFLIRSIWFTKCVKIEVCDTNIVQHLFSSWGNVPSQEKKLSNVNHMIAQTITEKSVSVFLKGYQTI